MKKTILSPSAHQAEADLEEAEVTLQNTQKVYRSSAVKNLTAAQAMISRSILKA